MSHHKEGHDVPRISAADAKKRIDSGALFVCAYDEFEKWAEQHPFGSLSLGDFRRRESGLEKKAEIIFYCA